MVHASCWIGVHSCYSATALLTQVFREHSRWGHLEALTTYLHFETWERLMDFLMRGLEIGPYALPKN